VFLSSSSSAASTLATLCAASAAEQVVRPFGGPVTFLAACAPPGWAVVTQLAFVDFQGSYFAQQLLCGLLFCIIVACFAKVLWDLQWFLPEPVAAPDAPHLLVDIRSEDMRDSDSVMQRLRAMVSEVVRQAFVEERRLHVLGRGRQHHSATH
jgi:hypothetical protein